MKSLIVLIALYSTSVLACSPYDIKMAREHAKNTTCLKAAKGHGESEGYFHAMDVSAEAAGGQLPDYSTMCFTIGFRDEPSARDAALYNCRCRRIHRPKSKMGQKIRFQYLKSRSETAQRKFNCMLKEL